MNEQTTDTSTEQFTELVFEDLEEAQRSVSDTERAAYQDAQQSVVDARRNAERHEGTLRIN
jgi:hypothetical protein